jgi:hypothetical protein
MRIIPHSRRKARPFAYRNGSRQRLSVGENDLRENSRSSLIGLVYESSVSLEKIEFDKLDSGSRSVLLRPR